MSEKSKIPVELREGWPERSMGMDLPNVPDELLPEYRRLRAIELAARQLIPKLLIWAPNSMDADRLRKSLGLKDISWEPSS